MGVQSKCLQVLGVYIFDSLVILGSLMTSSDERKLPKISVKSNTSDDVQIVKEIPATTSGYVLIVKEIPATSALASQNVAAGHSTSSPNLMQSCEQSSTSAITSTLYAE